MRTRRKTTTLLVISILLFIGFTSIPPKQGIPVQCEPADASKDRSGSLKGTFGAEQAVSEAAGMSQQTHNHIQQLVTMAEAENGLGGITTLGRGKSVDLERKGRNLFKCLSGGNLAATPRGRLAYNLPAGKEVTVTYSIEGANICHRRPHPSVLSQFFLGFIFHQGRGIPADYQKALKWYLRASRNGFAHANYYLGKMFHSGQGVQQNAVNAEKYYRKAAKEGLAEAQYQIGEIYANGEHSKPCVAEALKWYRKAAAQGHLLALAKIDRFDPN